MEMTQEKRDQINIIGLRGRLDAVACSGVEKQLLAQADQDQVRIAFDLSAMSYVSSAGLRLLISVAKQVEMRGGKLALATLNHDVYNIFKIAGVIPLFSVYETVDEAASYCTG